MGYYVRCFCKSSTVPTLHDALGQVAKKHPQLQVGAGNGQAPDLRDPDWISAFILYKPGKQPLEVEINRRNGPTRELVEDEIQEFTEFLEEVPDESAKQRVIDHLDRTQFIVASRLETADIDDDGYDANGTFLRYFVDHAQGMIQADGEGFYEGENLVVAVP